MADARIYEATETLEWKYKALKGWMVKYLKINAQVSSGKFMRNLNKNCGYRIPGYPYLYFSFNDNN
jgi:hypothetical protein